MCVDLAGRPAFSAREIRVGDEYDVPVTVVRKYRDNWVVEHREIKQLYTLCPWSLQEATLVRRAERPIEVGCRVLRKDSSISSFPGIVVALCRGEVWVDWGERGCSTYRLDELKRID